MCHKHKNDSLLTTCLNEKWAVGFLKLTGYLPKQSTTLFYNTTEGKKGNGLSQLHSLKIDITSIDEAKGC